MIKEEGTKSRNIKCACVGGNGESGFLGVTIIRDGEATHAVTVADALVQILGYPVNANRVCGWKWCFFVVVPVGRNTKGSARFNPMAGSRRSVKKKSPLRPRRIARMLDPRSPPNGAPARQRWLWCPPFWSAFVERLLDPT